MSKSYQSGEANDDSGLTEPGETAGVYRARHDPDGPRTVSETVINSIAEVADIDPTNTVVPIGERVDADALDALFASDEGLARVTFRVCGLRVLVRSDGRIRIANESVADE
ncbi:HalOD1 output domain-containing protein [Halorussus amylolyticus]|uniref:HalOD1 output domain-containing protein n=1 Tax=Halorussus amylolyticus TaxID=1126242 RepID=UPI00104BE3B5|nr:HalOD1 output domain-containing protein [Halorussus amylolyticus]